MYNNYARRHLKQLSFNRKIMNRPVYFLFMLALLSRCSEKPVQPAVAPRDTTITVQNAFSELSLDSMRLEKFILQAATSDSVTRFLRSFYNNRNYHFAWFTQEGLAEPALAFWNLHNQFINYSRDSAIVDKQLHKQMELLISQDTSFMPASDAVTQLELQLTEHFYEYAHYAYGGRVDPLELQWHIPRKKVNAMALLDTLIANEGRSLEELEPLNVSYKLLKDELLRYYDIESKGGWNELVMESKRYKPGDSSDFIVQIKYRLYATGDYDSNDTSPKFTDRLTEAVKQAQKRFGFRADGFITAGLVKELNVPVEERIKQLLINMERMRWLPKEQAGNRIVANIPEFKLHVFEDGNQIFDMDIVVGKEGTRTVVFTDELKYIVFSPYWNIPRSIIRNEILPAMQRNPSYLVRNNMEQTGYSNGLPVIRQKPGGSNALGRVKFIFPNNYSIYFHDTPAKSLFKREKRAFSHGCIRLSEPKKLAEYLLRNKSEWTAESINKAMRAGSEKWVTLDKPVPVSISYFTAWVDRDGLLNFREDIYGHDKKMADRLFELN